MVCYVPFVKTSLGVSGAGLGVRDFGFCLAAVALQCRATRP